MLKIDTQVKIRKDLHADTKYNDIYCHYGMLKFAGKLVTIGDIPFDTKPEVFLVKEDLEGYLFNYAMIDVDWRMAMAQ